MWRWDQEAPTLRSWPRAQFVELGDANEACVRRPGIVLKFRRVGCPTGHHKTGL